MRRRIAEMNRPLLAGLLVFAGAWALFSLATQPLTGYEPETGAVTEGLVLEGHLWDDEGSSLPLSADIVGRDGHRYARTGLPQPLLEAPFFALGHQDRSLAAALVLFFVALTAVVGLFVWGHRGFHDLDYRDTLRLVIPAITMLILGVQTVLASFFVSILGIERSRRGG